MALNAYISNTQNLLQLPGASPTTLYSTASITTFVNTARSQLAGEGECIRFLATIPAVIGQRNYSFSALNTGVKSSNGIQGVLHVRRVMINSGTGFAWLEPRPWPWFDLYHLNNSAPVNGPPTVWAQYAQGVLGSFFLDPPPDLTYTMTVDAVCYPQTLASDNDVEAIPYPWTDAISYFAAYLALMSSQTSARIMDAQKMLELYQTFVQRARQFSNPSVGRPFYEQTVDPAQSSAYGFTQDKNKAA